MRRPQGGRPRRGSLPTRLSVVLYPEDKDWFEKLEGLSATERKSISDLTKIAIASYLGVHYPGNPQPPLMAQSDEPTEFNQISLGFMRHTLKSDIARMEDPKILDKHFIKARLEKSLLKAAKVYDRTQDPELKALIQKAREILKV